MLALAFTVSNGCVSHSTSSSVSYNHSELSPGDQELLEDFWAELRHRKVVRVAIAYLAVGAIVVGAADDVLPDLQLAWAAPLVTVLTLLGFPIALVLAWAYDLTPRGVRTSHSRSPEGPPEAGAELASIAVLRFRNLTPGSDCDYLVEAFPFELNATFSRVHNLRVISHETAMAKGTQDTGLARLAEELGVQYAISGAVARIGDRVQIAAELGDAIDQSIIWTKSFEVDATDLMTVPNVIAKAVVGEFGGERLRTEITKLSGTMPGDATAWQHVQMARAYLLDYTEDNLVEAKSLLKKALDIDPGYAVGHAVLGQVIAETTLAGVSANPSSDRSLAVLQAEKAQTLAPRDPLVLRATGSVYAYTGDYRRSIDNLRNTVELAPFDLGAWGYLCWPLVSTGKADDLNELMEIIDRLILSAPNHPGRAYWLFHQSVALLCSGDTEKALRKSQKSNSEQPTFSIGSIHLANILGILGRKAEARSIVERCVANNSRFTTSYYAELMGVLTDQADVIEIRTAGLRGAQLLPTS